MFERLLEELAREMEARSIAYMVIGGQAVLPRPYPGSSG
jgi:hypothetical protein